jgi:transposase-like protein
VVTGLHATGEVRWRFISYGAANREMMPGIEYRQHKGLNNRAENSHRRNDQTGK